ncbi:hypothetical protein HN954_01830 [bacterium]|jgi:4-diphosphocytidyl-2-C-methyl-D-erythritol kinase|nr:hypothetical protein [bacterium]MBT6832205.1 hypothetical protein [bacterium]MBT6996150.1 hypothetical protein [bacterium]MBT7772230.1 hypothetical protein [bacterium]
MKKITGSAPAKINLTLDVERKNPGAEKHHVRTILHKISLADELTLFAADRFELHGDFDCDPEDNLIVQAWRVVRKYFPDSSAVIVRVQKNIPVASGLGGGSSNFAAFVKLYAELFDLKIPEELISESEKIGADIPFFFSGNLCALGENFGEKITLLDFNFSGKKIWLHVPPNKNLTAEMYANLKNFGTKFTEKFLENPDLEKCGNAFDEIFPADWRNVHLSGSGSAFFTLEKTEFQGHKIIEATLA